LTTASKPAADETVGPNTRTLAVLDTTPAYLVGIVPAAEATSGVGRRCYLHAGPPLGDDPLPPPMRGALLGALVFEGEAADLAEAQELVDAGEVSVSSCHESGGVGAMAGIVTPSMPVVVVESDAGRRAFSPLNEGLGRALRFGSNQPDILTRLAWIRDVAAPLLDGAVASLPRLDVTTLQTEGLRRGDECHNRNVASTAALVARLAPALVGSDGSRENVAAVLHYASSNPHFFLPFSMAAGKVVADSAHGIAGSSIVTAISANGRRVGIRVSGLGDSWFVGDAPVGTPRLFDGFTIDDVQPMMGDSFVTEVIGLGAFAMQAAPAIASFIGGDPAELGSRIDEMRAITVGRSSRFLVPHMGFGGTPLGIDVERVVATGIPPLVNNGLAHRKPGGGQVGAGLTTLPLEPFVAAAEELRAVTS
jgi:hypothetical protein